MNRNIETYSDNIAEQRVKTAENDLWLMVLETVASDLVLGFNGTNAHPVKSYTDRIDRAHKRGVWSYAQLLQVDLNQYALSSYEENLAYLFSPSFYEVCDLADVHALAKRQELTRMHKKHEPKIDAVLAHIDKKYPNMRGWKAYMERVEKRRERLYA